MTKRKSKKIQRQHIRKYRKSRKIKLINRGVRKRKRRRAAKVDVHLPLYFLTPEIRQRTISELERKEDITPKEEKLLKSLTKEAELKEKEFVEWGTKVVRGEEILPPYTPPPKPLPKIPYRKPLPLTPQQEAAFKKIQKLPFLATSMATNPIPTYYSILDLGHKELEKKEMALEKMENKLKKTAEGKDKLDFMQKEIDREQKLMKTLEQPGKLTSPEMLHAISMAPMETTIPVRGASGLIEMKPTKVKLGSLAAVEAKAKRRYEESIQTAIRKKLLTPIQVKEMRKHQEAMEQRSIELLRPTVSDKEWEKAKKENVKTMVASLGHLRADWRRKKQADKPIPHFLEMRIDQLKEMITEEKGRQEAKDIFKKIEEGVRKPLRPAPKSYITPELAEALK